MTEPQQPETEYEKAIQKHWRIMIKNTCHLCWWVGEGLKYHEPHECCPHSGKWPEAAVSDD